MCVTSSLTQNALVHVHTIGAIYEQLWVIAYFLNEENNNNYYTCFQVCLKLYLE